MLRLKINEIVRECEILPMPEGCFAENYYDYEYSFPAYIAVCAKTEEEAKSADMEGEPAVFTLALNYWWREPNKEPIFDEIILHSQLDAPFLYKFLKQEHEGDWPRFERILGDVLKIPRGIDQLDPALDIMIREMRLHKVPITPEVELIIEKKLYKENEEIIKWWSSL